MTISTELDENGWCDDPTCDSCETSRRIHEKVRREIKSQEDKRMWSP